MIDLRIKRKLYDHCVSHINEKIAALDQEMRSIQSSASEETKSSAGDKYETGRAMLMLENEKLASQRDEAYKMQRLLSGIDPNKSSESVELGSLIETKQALYFISIGFGKIELDGQIIFAVSPASPIGAALNSKKVGEEIEFNGRQSRIIKVC